MRIGAGALAETQHGVRGRLGARSLASATGRRSATCAIQPSGNVFGQRNGHHRIPRGTPLRPGPRWCVCRHLHYQGFFALQAAVTGFSQCPRKSYEPSGGGRNPATGQSLVPGGTASAALVPCDVTRWARGSVVMNRLGRTPTLRSPPIECPQTDVNRSFRFAQEGRHDKVQTDPESPQSDCSISA